MRLNLTNALLLAATASLTMPLIGQAAPKNTLTVIVNNLRNQQGQVCASLFASSQGFPDRADRAVQARCTQATGDRTVLTFQNLAVGNYAVAVYSDRNNNGKLNRNFLGIPTEGFGFSRNPTIRTGAPQFSEAAVLVVGATKTEIQLQYLLGG